jgi:poly-beta-hydroxyalkanoate depolymerase
LNDEKPLRLQGKDVNQVLPFKKRFSDETAQRQQRMRVLRLVFDIREQQRVAHCHPDLSQYGIFAGSEERFDLQVLLDPFKEEFNLPPGLINCRNR